MKHLTYIPLTISIFQGRYFINGTKDLNRVDADWKVLWISKELLKTNVSGR